VFLVFHQLVIGAASSDSIKTGLKVIDCYRNILSILHRRYYVII
jgi:hypothetical protein